MNHWKRSEICSELVQLKLNIGASKDYVYASLGKTVIIDARTEKEYKGSRDAGEARGGHIQGAKLNRVPILYFCFV
ncbi:MAG: hypothetical protein APF81_00995 [Desulfosporosinus sp. BRH_c37]|nr:MAG: hypothetical protein APF81_00995 [Desulfosporosinus sp. BRH_c37]